MVNSKNSSPRFGSDSQAGKFAPYKSFSFEFTVQELSTTSCHRDTSLMTHAFSEQATKTFRGEEAYPILDSLRAYMQSLIFGQDELITETLCTFLAGGHLLMTGAPGLAKTTLVRVFAEKLGLSFGRVQFTPDLLPTDITGADILNTDPQSGERRFAFLKGPIFTNLLLADEINRASPRTQSAMLEAMQERQVTFAGQCYPLPQPFMVFATQNPFESEGTFPLPEAQLDRFLIHALITYPDAEAELNILNQYSQNLLVGQAQLAKDENAKLSLADIHMLIQTAKHMPLRSELLQLINELIRSSRPQDPLCPANLQHMLWYGAGPRAGLSLIAVSKALALLEKESEVRWRHIKRMAKPVLRHRIRVTNQASAQALHEDALIDHLMERIEKKYSQLT